ncbi:helix-turn-helix transcriptional regulator [Amycolatopsis sp., V23-08]|uniref:Helix-turn-helix transcriptional regulator n=1 Tax=Amycolatopsis heterodermiae TaxID=3110235 RepID=A0ABU5RJV3_9PSEU|nr:helix-turn-helix transcriptional regulator [Amycolatopsis sp., V23-08]MEA5366578.1 helix-turn-helix transcriptional regulator [Amycolatopsis sp., V23-08]
MARTSGRGTRPEFGPELRRLRIAAGLSMHGLGELTKFSKGYISKVETGQKSPSSHFVRVTDSALSASGQLIALAKDVPQEAADNTDGVATSDNPQAHDPPRAGRTATFKPTATVSDADAKYALDGFRAILATLRDLGQALPPSSVAEMIKPHISALRNMAVHTTPQLSRETLRLAAHFADFTSWMTQESGDDVTALRWIDLSVELAEEIGDNDLIANSYLRRANIAMYQQDAYGTIRFAKQAQGLRPGDRVKALAAQREAQGHALAGDYDKFQSCIDRARSLMPKKDANASSSPVIGPTRIADPVALARGWSLFDLGRCTEAIAILEPLLEQTSRERSRAWARIAARLALALASIREVDRACVIANEIISLTPVIQSATIRSDLRQLARILNRWNSSSAVRELTPQLSAALLPVAEKSMPARFETPGQ